MKTEHTPNCWCGVQMKKIGEGNYPYECNESRDYPDRIVYVALKCDHKCWTTAEHDLALRSKK